MGTMEEVDVVLKRFGDEQSTLLDRFERLSFEVQLNQAMLGRSLSEPSVYCRRMPAALVSKVSQGKRHPYHHRGLVGFQKVWKKLIRPILGRKRRDEVSQQEVGKDLRVLKAFSRSLRV